MKLSKTILLTLYLFFLFFSCSKNEELKSVYGLQKDVIVSIKKYDRKGRLIFDRQTQIIEDWNNEHLTWITAKEFISDKLSFEYYAHSNTGLNIKYYDYGKNGKLLNEYSKHYDSSNREGRNPFAEIYKIETLDSLKYYLHQIISDSIGFSKYYKANPESTEFFNTFIDSIGQINKEYWTIIDSSESKRKIEKYDDKGNLIYKSYRNYWNSIIEEYKYNSYGKLIEEIEFSPPNKNRYQRKKHIYSDGLLQKTLFYHDTSLAFKYEYFYDDLLLNKEIRTRVTESEHFKNRRKIDSIEYKYEYFE